MEGLAELEAVSFQQRPSGLYLYEKRRTAGAGEVSLLAAGHTPNRQEGGIVYMCTLESREILCEIGSSPKPTALLEAKAFSRSVSLGLARLVKIFCAPLLGRASAFTLNSSEMDSL